jgi:hypothetical protein
MYRLPGIVCCTKNGNTNIQISTATKGYRKNITAAGTMNRIGIRTSQFLSINKETANRARNKPRPIGMMTGKKIESRKDPPFLPLNSFSITDIPD